MNHYRAAFDIPNDVTYFNCAFHSPQISHAREAGVKGILNRGRPWEIDPRHLFDDLEQTRELFAAIIGGDKEGVAIVPSVSYGIAVAAKNLIPSDRRIVLLPEGEFPSNVYVWRELAREGHLQVRMVKPAVGQSWTDAMVENLSEEVAVVMAPPCHWCDGRKFDLTTIGKKARSVGASFVIDGSQLVGTTSIQLKEWDPDYFLCVGYKWLLGPYGISYLYVPERRRQDKPLEFGWLNRKGCEDFSRLCEYTDEMSAGARRFDAGQKGNPILLPMANAALETLNGWGLSDIARRIESVSTALVKELELLGLEVPPLSERYHHILGVKAPSAREWVKKLAERKVYVSARHDALRISVHVFNTLEDVKRFTTAATELYFPTDSSRSNKTRLVGP